LAENGQQAIAVLTEHPEVRAIVLDLAMPVMSGDTAGPMMRTLRPDMPLILSSGYSESGEFGLGPTWSRGSWKCRTGRQAGGEGGRGAARIGPAPP